jgi:hypothetical protein
MKTFLKISLQFQLNLTVFFTLMLNQLTTEKALNIEKFKLHQMKIFDDLALKKITISHGTDIPCK